MNLLLFLISVGEKQTKESPGIFHFTFMVNTVFAVLSQSTY